jgi:hypothetical protein
MKAGVVSLAPGQLLLVSAPASNGGKCIVVIVGPDPSSSCPGAFKKWFVLTTLGEPWCVFESVADAWLLRWGSFLTEDN